MLSFSQYIIFVENCKHFFHILLIFFISILNYIYCLENGTYLPGCLALIDLSNALDTTPTQLLDSYLFNKNDCFLEKISQNIDKISDKDLNLILNIIDF